MMNDDEKENFKYVPKDIMEFMQSKDFDYLTRLFVSRKYNLPAARIIIKLTSTISCLINGGDDDKEFRGKCLYDGLNNYLKIMPTNPKKLDHLKMFEYCEIPDYLVCLYKSPIRNNKEIAEEAIRLFLYPNIESFPIYIQHLFGILASRFCYLLHCDKTKSPNLLYYLCRQTFGRILKSIGPSNTSRFFHHSPPKYFIRKLYRYIKEFIEQLLVNMKLIRQSCFCRVPLGIRLRFESDIGEFSLWTLHMCTNIVEHMRSIGLSLDSLPMAACVFTCFHSGNYSYYVKQLSLFYDDFDSLLNSIDVGLTYMDDGVEYTRCTECEFNYGWSYYLSILKELDMISKLYHPAEKKLSSCLNSHRDSINKLIMKSKRGDDHQWLLRHRSLLNNESRRHLITMMFPDRVKNGSDHLEKKMKVIIDKSNLLGDSFELLGLVDPILLRNGIIPHFKNEVAYEAGPGVFREWLVLVCRRLFTPQTSLFLSCPHDHERFYPNPAKLDPQQLKYYRFCGRMIALALMQDVQMGIGFDRLFFLQLAGSNITLEDTRDADPYMYKSCKDILEMDNEFIDSDGLGLTFVWEIEEVDESGSGRKIVELCPGGNTMVVNSLNKEEYIELVIRHCFVKSIEEKVKLFIQGLDDVLTRRRRKIFFQSVELEDLDDILLERPICEMDSKEDNDCTEVANNSTHTPFERIIRTTLWTRKPIYRPLKCKQQYSRMFLH